MRTSALKSFSVAFLATIEIILVFGFTASPVRAETRVQGYIQDGTVWTAENSPYLLEDNVTVPDSATLTIGPGVSVGLASDVNPDDLGYTPAFYVNGGRLSIQGTGKNRVSINGIVGISINGGSISNGSADIADADFTGGAGLSFNESRGTIGSSTITGANQGLYLHDSIVSVWGSRIKGNQTGIYVQPHRVFMVDNDLNSRSLKGSGNGKVVADGLAMKAIADSNIRFGVDGIGNASQSIAINGQLAVAPEIFASSSLVIRGSSIADNTGRAVYNNGSFTVDAAGNWWGSASGPVTAGANSIQGQVNAAPWLTAEPPLDGDNDPPDCCSSILFLPGLEGTRLYSIVPNPISQFIRIPTTTDQLWEPHGYSNVTALYLKANGSSTDSSIYSGAPVDTALGMYGVYGKFMSYLDGLVKKGTVSEWRAFGYDWREPVAEVVAGSEIRQLAEATTTESLVRTVADLAARSKTGKVTIVAHSNGGLVAKDLVKTLADTGKSNLIDSVISVAVPYLGTPSAIPKMLNGYEESIAYGLIATEAHMRGLGANMPSAYSLLPSRGFFSSVADAFKPTIAYASTTMDSFDAQSAFIADAGNAHQAVPNSSSDVTSPIKGNQLLMAAADAIHGLLDPFVWPTAIARFAIVGWNAETPKQTSYSSSGYTVENTYAGDGTVIAPSADYNAGQAVSVDLKTQSDIEKKDITHGNILEASTTVAAIDSIVSNPATDNTKVLDQISKLPGVTIGSLDWAHVDDARRDLEISTHSPVALNVYDNQGRHTGEIPMPAQLVGKVEDGFYTFYENGIPGSSFHKLGDHGDGHADESVTVPDDGNKYTVVVNGTAAGSFELDVDRIYATTTVDSVSWKGMPVDPLTVATTTIISGGNPMIPNLASSTSALSLDINGDGTVDATSSPNTSLDTDSVLQMLEKASDSLDHNGSRGKSFINRLEHARGVWKSWQAKKTTSSHRIDFEGIGGSVGHLKLKGMSAADKDRIWNGIDAFVKQFE